VTLADLIPSLRSSLPRRLEPGLWPISARHLPGGDVSLGGVSLCEVAAQHSTPTVVLDVAEFRERCEDFRRAFRDIDVTFTGGSLLTEGTAAVLQEERLSLGIYCEAQLATAVAVGFPVDRMIVHAAPGRPALIRRAASLGVGQIIIESIDQIDTLTTASRGTRAQQVLVSIRAGTVDGVSDLSTHRRPAHGFCVTSGEAAEAVRRIRTRPGLRLVGVHCRAGSPFTVDACAVPKPAIGGSGVAVVAGFSGCVG
jgi:diaminopimelate decarboxylase